MQYIKGFEVGLNFDLPLLRDLVGSFVSLNEIGRVTLTRSSTRVSTTLARDSEEMIDANQRNNLI